MWAVKDQTLSVHYCRGSYSGAISETFESLSFSGVSQHDFGQALASQKVNETVTPLQEVFNQICHR